MFLYGIKDSVRKENGIHVKLSIRVVLGIDKDLGSSKAKASHPNYLLGLITGCPLVHTEIRKILSPDKTQYPSTIQILKKKYINELHGSFSINNAHMTNSRKLEKLFSTFL